MTTEDRLRAAIEARTKGVEPSSDGWDRIQARIERREHQWRRPAVVFPTVAAGLAVVVLAAALLTADEKGTDVRVAPPATEPPTTVAPPVTEAVTPALWPPAGTSQSFEDPKALALSFAKDFLGMPDPVVGEFRAPDEVDIRPEPRATGLVTTLEVVKGDLGAWSVVEAGSVNLQLDTPARDASASSPVALTGRSVAFEGTVQMAMLQAGETLAGGESLGKGTFTGRGDVLSPFQASLEFKAPTEPSGAIVLWTDSAEDGSVTEATVRRVHFQTIGGPVPESFVAITAEGRLVTGLTGHSAVLTPHPSDLNRLTRVAFDSAQRLMYVERPSDDPCFTEVVMADERGRDGSFFGVANPAVSLDGRMMAYTVSSPVPGPPGHDCPEATIAVREIRGDPATERTWRWAQSGDLREVRAIAWHSDGKTLAFESGGDVFLLDTTSAKSLDDARRVATGSLPLFVAANLAFVTPEGVMTVDSSGRKRLLFDPGITVTGIDVDASGRHFLLVDDKHNLYWSGGGVIEPLATGIVDADW